MCHKTVKIRRKSKVVADAIGEEFLLAAQCGLCGICQEPIDLGKDKVDLDHVFPINPEPGFAAGTARGNFFLTHKSCNQEKQNRQPTKHEVLVLAMVNDVLDYDESSGEYRRRSSIMYMLRDMIVEQQQKIERLERAMWEGEGIPPPSVSVAISVAEQTLKVLVKKYDYQYSVFRTYNCRFDCV